MTRNWTTLVAIGVLAATFAMAQTVAPSAAPALTLKAKVQRRLMKSLDLTAAQKTQAKSILQNSKQQVQPLAAQLKQDRQSLTAAIQANDAAKIQQLSAQVGTLQGQVLGIRAGGRAQFFALLTPDQKVKAAEFEQKVKEVVGAKGE
jgi:Spy/CpxP family protein refolding chaperone